MARRQAVLPETKLLDLARDPMVRVEVEWCGQLVRRLDQSGDGAFHDTPHAPAPGLMEYMRTMFLRADKDGSGALSREELEGGISC